MGLDARLAGLPPEEVERRRFGGLVDSLPEMKHC